LRIGIGLVGLCIAHQEGLEVGLAVAAALDEGGVGWEGRAGPGLGGRNGEAGAASAPFVPEPSVDVSSQRCPVSALAHEDRGRAWGQQSLEENRLLLQEKKESPKTKAWT
jgi:hypothetical protein